MIFVESDEDYEESEEDEEEARPPGPNRGIKQLTPVERVKITTLHEAGHSIHAISRTTGRNRDTVRRCIHAWLEEGILSRKSGTGGKVKTSPQTDRLILRAVKRDPFVNAEDILLKHPNIGICSKTIQRRLHALGGYGSYWASAKPFLTQKNVKARLEWAREHINWTPDMWKRVLFSDESPFTLRFNRKLRVWRQPNERYLPKHIRGTVKHDKKINVWGGFCAHGKTALRLISGIMDTNEYLTILEDTMVPGTMALFPDDNFIFQQDNDPKHTARLTREWFQWASCPVLKWPSQSPDLNPIENLWAILNHRVRKRQCNNEAELLAVLQTGWAELPVDLLDKLVASMPERCQAVIDAKGWSTKY